MNASLHAKSAAIPRLLRQGARICGGVLFSLWVVLVALEFRGSLSQLPGKEMIYQGGALSLVFAGYWLSIKRPVVGSLLTFGATACFFLVAFATSGTWPPLEAAWLVLPAVLALSAWVYRRRRRLIRRLHISV